MADWMWISFALVSGVGREMRGGDRRRGRAVLWVNLGRSIVTNDQWGLHCVVV